MKKDIVAISLIIFIVLIPGCIRTPEEEESTSSPCQYYYSIAFETSQWNNFTLLCPVIVNSNGSLSDIMNNVVEKNGEITTNIEVFEGTQFLNISGQGSFDLSFNLTGGSEIYMYNYSRHPYNGIDFNTWTEPDLDSKDFFLGKILVHYNSYKVWHKSEIVLDLHIGYTHHFHYDFKTLEIGWNEIEIYVSSLMF